MVAPMSTTSPSSTAGSSTSCWDLLKRCTSSMKSMVPWPCSPRRRWASARASRTSFTPAAVADSVVRCLAVVSASRRASVVLPVPAGPHRIDDPTRSDSASRRKGRTGADEVLLAHDLIEGAGAETGCEGRLALEAAVGGVGEEAQGGGPALGGAGAGVGLAGGTTTRMPSSARLAAGSAVGAPVSRSAPDWVLG